MKKRRKGLLGLLLAGVLVKAEAHEMGIRAISQKHGNLLLEFQPQPNIDPQKLMQLLTSADGGSTLSQAATAASSGNTAQMVAMLKKIIQSPEGAALMGRLGSQIQQ